MVRPGLLPALLAAAAALAGVGLVGSGFFDIIRYVLSILALIIAVYVWQGRKWPFLIPLVAIAVAWNPVFPFDFAGPLWTAAHVLAAAVFLAVGLLLKVPDREHPTR